MNRRITRVVSTLAVSWIVAACAREASVPPLDLMGRWSAETGRHTGLVFEVRCRSVFLQQTQGFDVFPITGLRVDSVGQETTYELDIDLHNGQSDRIRLTRDPARPDVLFMGRTRQPWKRNPDAAVPWPEMDTLPCAPDFGTRDPGRAPVPEQAGVLRANRRR